MKNDEQGIFDENESDKLNRMYKMKIPKEENQLKMQRKIPVFRSKKLSTKIGNQNISQREIFGLYSKRAMGL